MGTLRILLALSVVCVHVGQPLLGLSFFGTGAMAVESFFILSGFYMALVLRTKYRTDVGRFYTARLTRLLPMYWLVLLTSLGLCIGLYLVFQKSYGLVHGFGMVPSVWLYPVALVANAFLVGSDVILLYEGVARVSAEQLLALPAAWSLSTELLFYSIAPFLLNRRVAVIATVFALLLAVRVAIWIPAGGEWTVWNYYFSISSLHLFLLGSLAYLAYEHLSGVAWFAKSTQVVGTLALAAVAALILFYKASGLFGFQDYRYYLLFAASLPFIFARFRESSWDRAWGEYSYPLYLTHGLVLTFYRPLYRLIPNEFRIYGVLVLSLLGCWLLLWIEPRIAPYLRRRSRGQSVPTSADSPVFAPVAQTARSAPEA